MLVSYKRNHLTPVHKVIWLAHARDAMLSRPFLLDVRVNVLATGGKETLMANRAVEEDTKKARRSFFHYGAIPWRLSM